MLGRIQFLVMISKRQEAQLFMQVNRVIFDWDLLRFHKSYQHLKLVDKMRTNL